MWNVISNFIHTDIDIVVYGGEKAKEIDNTSDGNVFVYLAKIEDIKLCSADIGTSKENKENKVLLQRNSGLALLKYAVKDRWGIDEDLSKIKVSDNGKPYVDNYKFSISHCGNLVCVAISKVEVGVDLECVTRGRDWRGLRRRVLTSQEKELLAEDSQTMTENWTKKEAVFKLVGGKVFSPSNIDIGKYYTDTLSGISCEDNDFVLSIATNDKTNNYLFVKKAFLYNNTWELD